MMKRTTYKDSGVDIRKADVFVGGLKRMFKAKDGASPAAFGSLFDLGARLGTCKEPVLVSSTDGVGTKLLIAQQLGIHTTVGVDCVAMNTNDVICLGARPLFFLDYIACGTLKPQVLLSVAKGIKEGLDESQCQLIGGETAEMPGLYGADEYDLAGFCVGLADKKRLVDGSRMEEGDVIIGLESSGFHSNGFSLVRKVLPPKEIKRYAKELLRPTRIYVRPILSLLELDSAQGAVKGIAHITGGAFYAKATKIVPAGLGMVIEKKAWAVPDIFTIVQKKGAIAERQMYTVFNMGIGMLVVVDRGFAREALSHLSKYCPARIVGEIVRSKKKMAVR